MLLRDYCRSSYPLKAVAISAAANRRPPASSCWLVTTNQKMTPGKLLREMMRASPSIVFLLPGAFM